MHSLSKSTLACTEPGITAGRLMSIRNIYLRQELSTISDEIQENYKDRLPLLHLVSLAAYEQVFNRQPLSLPEDLRRDAVKYGLKYYQLNIEKLAEIENGLLQIHDRQSNVEKDSNIIQSNHNLPAKDQIKENQSSLQTSISLNKTKDEDTSYDSFQTDNKFDSISTDIENIETSASSDESSTIIANKNDISSNLTFPSINTSSSLIDTSSDTKLNSFNTDPLMTSRSNGSMTTSQTDQSSTSIKKLSRTKPPKIIVRRPSNHSLTSINNDDSLMTIDRNETPAEEQTIDVHYLSAHKRKSKKQRKHKRD
ncbi:unnamed protein product [Rotaria sp. Silwood1]|nr:unnamed protein product [Rotaria sp. Silwood1]CAF3419865.1 unnamed protein product [Rotaria sp. Silwood1]CAF3444833.1 unnamed protein product [Rotaria sp. Silwood1]CAF4641264.1 unnamed protein product [Rotaria sp. Silwood1]CAF4731451.1 unnamed protein product [Rotaria sp. Silwood1]